MSGPHVVLAAQRARSGLRPQQLRGGRLARADAKHGSGHQKRKAAHGRVADHDSPHRKRQGQRHSHCAHSNHCGNQNHPCHHLTHPLCGVWSQGVGAPWQDYVLGLEILRRIKRVDLVRFWAIGTMPGATPLARADGSKALLQAEGRGSCGNDGGKLLAVKENPSLIGLSARHLLAAGKGWMRGRKAGAATCRKPGALSRQANPEVAEECLSFVIPGQQGGPGNRGEVH